MNKTKLALALTATLALSACGTTNKYEKRAEALQEQRQEIVEVAIDKAPKWMTKLPESTSAVYAAGTSVSGSMAFSKTKALTIAYSRVCMAAGGKVDQQTKIFQSDTNNTSVERSETAIRSFCNGVDISGVEEVEIKIVAEGSRFRTYALVALPIGEANVIQKFNEQRLNERVANGRSQQAFREMDARRVEDNATTNEVIQQSGGVVVTPLAPQ